MFLVKNLKKFFVYTKVMLKLLGSSSTQIVQITFKTQI
jgi:hypothetical protein